MDNYLDLMYEEALKAFNNAYAPYSKFRVGASVLLKDKTIINGCNIENSSYGLSNCAERTALFKTISLGYKKTDIIALLVVAQTKDPVSPCGACRQVISEFMNKDCLVYLTNLNKDIVSKTVDELLPYSFSGDVL